MHFTNVTVDASAVRAAARKEIERRRSAPRVRRCPQCGSDAPQPVTSLEWKRWNAGLCPKCMTPTTST